MATGWVVQETSGVFNNQPILLRVDYTQKDNQGYVVFIFKNTFFSKKFYIDDNYFHSSHHRYQEPLFMNSQISIKVEMIYATLT